LPETLAQLVSEIEPMRPTIARRLLILCDLTQRRYLNSRCFALTYPLPWNSV